MKKKKINKENIPRTPTYYDQLKMITGEKNDVETIESSLQPTKVIPTRFTSFNRAVVAGGAPVRCTYLIHGPPAGGKSIFLIGLLNSFVENGHFAMMVDAEHASTKEWYNHLKIYMDRILYYQPDTFEDAIDKVDEAMINFKKAKKEGNIHPDACFAFGVDVIHKLVPKGELDELRSDRKGGGAQNLNKGWGMRRANMIATWLGKLTPIVGKENFAFIALAHETEIKDDSKKWLGGTIIKVKGGGELVYEAMLRIRVQQGKSIYEDKELVGRSHVGMIEKNKVGHDREQFKFFIGNGKGSIPSGFDRGSEIFEECCKQNIIVPTGAWYNINDGNNNIERIQGKDNVISLLRNNDNIYNYYFALLNGEISNE